MFKLAGAEQLQRRLLQAGTKALPIIGGALVEIGEEVMTESQRQVPVLTGALKNSGRVFGAWGGVTRYARSAMGMMGGAGAASIVGMGGQNEATVTLAYGGTALKYALYVHEIARYHHPVGKYHYLSDPVNARRVRFAAQLGAKLRGRLDRALAR